MCLRQRASSYRYGTVTLTLDGQAGNQDGSPARSMCDNLESYRDYDNRLPRGCTYVRNGSVVDLQIAPGRIAAMVSGSELYDVAITVQETAKARWRAICAADCAGGIDSLVELLQGRFSKGVMERLCRQEGGLFPRPSDIRFTCSCPDHASMCKHVAAVLYGVGARLDRQPELLFRLRAVDETELVAGLDTALPLSKTGPAAGKVLDTDDMSALFGLDLAVAEVPAAGKPSDRSRAAHAGRASSLPDETASAANAVAPVRATPKRATATRATAPNKAPIKPVVSQQAPAVTEVARTKSPAPKAAVTARAASGRTVTEKTVGAADGAVARQDPVKTSEPTGTHRRVEAVPVAPAVVLELPARGRGRRSGSNHKTGTVREPRQKPVKWW